jgi:hypothetical protein
MALTTWASEFKRNSLAPRMNRLRPSLTTLVAKILALSSCSGCAFLVHSSHRISRGHP